MREPDVSDGHPWKRSDDLPAIAPARIYARQVRHRRVVRKSLGDRDRNIAGQPEIEVSIEFAVIEDVNDSRKMQGGIVPRRMIGALLAKAYDLPQLQPMRTCLLPGFL